MLMVSILYIYRAKDASHRVGGTTKFNVEDGGDEAFSVALPVSQGARAMSKFQVLDLFRWVSIEYPSVWHRGYSWKVLLWLVVIVADRLRVKTDTAGTVRGPEAKNSLWRGPIYRTVRVYEYPYVWVAVRTQARDDA